MPYSTLPVNPFEQLQEMKKRELDGTMRSKKEDKRAVVVAELAARSLPIPQDQGSNPVASNSY